MSEVQKQKQHPIPPRLEAQLKSKGASLPTQDDYGGAGNAVKGQDERPKTAPLTAFPAPMLSCALFTLDSGRCRHTRNDTLKNRPLPFARPHPAVTNSQSRCRPPAPTPAVPKPDTKAQAGPLFWFQPGYSSAASSVWFAKVCSPIILVCRRQRTRFAPPCAFPT